MLERYGLEDELEELNPELFDTYWKFVEKYKTVREEFCMRYEDSDENSFTHARRIMRNADRLIDHCLYDLNDDEIFVFLLACLFAGSGMDDDKEYEEMDLDKILADDHLRDDPINKILQMIYKFHFEFGTAVGERCQPLIMELSADHVRAIGRLVKINNKRDLYNEKLLPRDYKLSNGNEIHLQYLGPVLFFAANMDNNTELAKYSRESVLEYDKFTQEYLDSLKLIDFIKIRNHSIDLLMREIPKDNLGFTFYVQQLKDDLVTTKELIESNPGFYMRQNKINIVDLNNLDTKIF
ncbi:MAG: hypothetical protein Q4E88_02005 [Coriobacteriia bacterium]|nr:hypothetical protein [Coriobacteriia bacterium]